MLWDEDATEVEVSPELCIELSADLYSPNTVYEGAYVFRKHAFPLIGELKASGEEFECAQLLDQHDKVGRWVRNLPRQEGSFWLQTSTDRTYPDFVAELIDGRILVIEYKSARDWTNDDSKDKRAVGDLWAARSEGRCIYVMPNGPDWQAIERAIVG